MEMKRKVIFIFRFRNYSLHELELDWKLEASRGRDFCVRDVVAVKFNIYTMTTIQKLLNLVVTTRINKKQRIVKIKNSNLFPLNDQSSSLQQEGRNN